MDPVSQATVGALWSQTSSSPAKLAKAATLGTLAGMAPDLDVLIQSSSDPLLALEFHRQFSHSLLFIPFGGLLCAILFYAVLGRWWRLNFREVWLWCTLGYATHGLLDACTSYGTQLLWPLTTHRFAFDNISIIDPLFTVPLVLLVIVAALRKTKTYVYWGVAWCIAYLGLGLVQHERALQLGEQLAEQRGHSVIQMHAKPSFANLIVWKIIYETDDAYHVAAVKPALAHKAAHTWSGEQVPKLNIARDFPWLDPNSQQAQDIERFRWFSAGFLALDPNNPARIADMRYSLLPQEVNPLWGIELSPNKSSTEHVTYYTTREDSEAAAKTLWQMLWQ